MRNLIVLCWLASACVGPPPADDPAPVVVWTGWNHTWAMLSHRVARLRAVLEPDETLSMGIVGGDWSTGESFSDDVNYRMHYQRIVGLDVPVEHGETPLQVGPDGHATVSAHTTLAGSSIVVLRGFDIDTDVDQAEGYPEDYDPAHGYTSRGFGFSLGPVSDGDFEVGATVRWGPQDRPAMNDAIPFATTGVTVYWTAIQLWGDVEETTVTGAVDLVRDPPNSEQEAFTEALDWTDGPGIAGIRSFDLSVTAQDGSDEGDYLRSFGVEVPPHPEGMAPETATAEITTSSVIEWATMRFEPTVHLAWLPIGTLDSGFDTTDWSVEGVTRSGFHEIGETEFPPQD